MKIDLGCTMEQLVEAVNEASAALSNMVTTYLAQGWIVTQGGDSFPSPAIPCSKSNISWTEYSALFPEAIPVNITYISGGDVILVTSISLGTIDGNAAIEEATETNLTTGAVTVVTAPQDYSLDELIVNKVV